MNILLGQSAGLYTFGNRANVQYSSIENGGATTPYHILLIAAISVEDIRLQRSTPAVGGNIEVYNAFNNDLLYGGLIGNILSFTFTGDTGDNTATAPAMSFAGRRPSGAPSR